ncbi:hypothetical protein D3C80_1029410 [compost metagenome]
MLDKLLQHFGVDKASIHIPRFIIDMRIAVTAGGVKTQRHHAVSFGGVNRFAFDLQIVQLAVFGGKTDVSKLRIGTGVRLHLRHGSQIIDHLFTAHIGVDHDVAKRLHLEHIFVGNITAINGIANAAAAHHRKISTGACHLRCQQQMSHIGLYKADFAAIPFQTTINSADLHIQLRFAFILERRQERQHLGVFGNFRRVKYALTFAIIISHFFLQIHRN